jgi:hypothetical protein
MKKSDTKEFKPKEPVDKNNPTYYVNNKDFYDALVVYKKQYDDAMSTGKEKPEISKYLGECVWKIARGLAQKHNFRNYSYIDDMVCAAIFSCINNMHMFNPEKSQNPFAYFTQCCYYDFLHVIKREKKESSKKRRLILSAGIETFDLQDQDDDDFTLPLIEYIQSFNDCDVQTAPVKKQKIKVETGLEEFFK